MLHVVPFLCLFVCEFVCVYFIAPNFTWNMADSTRKTLGDMEMSLNFFNEKFKLLVKRVSALESENHDLRVKNNALKSRLNSVADKLKEHELLIEEQARYKRRDCLEIKGLPYKEDENVDELVMNVAELAGVQLNEEDISICYRLQASDKPWTDQDGVVHRPGPPLIIAKFFRRSVKEAVYQARFSLKGKTTHKLENFDEADEDNNIDISESLRPSRKKLFKACLKVKKELKLSIVSTINGKICIKISRSSRPVYINCESDLAKLRRKLSTPSLPSAT